MSEVARPAQPTVETEGIRFEFAAHNCFWGMTARLAIEFRRPVPIQTPIRAEGRIVNARRRVVDTAARIVEVATGIELATATGVHVAADAHRTSELQARYGFRRLDGAPVAGAR